MHDLLCPYCQTPQKVNHDDGAGYQEGVRHEQTCKQCDKIFVFTTAITYSYEASRADCLNDSEHELKISNTWPRQASVMRCLHCDYERKPTGQEFEQAGITLDKN